MFYKGVISSFLLVSVTSGTFLQSQNVDSSYQVVHGWPKLPHELTLGQVSGVDVDSHNHVFVFHRENPPILCLDGASGRLLHSWGHNQFIRPHGLKVDQQDNVWVTDVYRHQVFKFSHSGKLLLTLGVEKEPGIDDRHFNKPTDVAFSSNGDVYVSDGYGNSRIVKLSSTGTFLLEWGSKGDQPGQFDIPHGITVDGAGKVYVADRSNSRIQIFDHRGKFLKEWKSQDLGRPWAVNLGRDGFLYVVDGGDLNPNPPDRGYALKLDLEGKILDKWGGFGSYDGQFYWAHTIAAARNGDVYVGDVHFGMRVQKFFKIAQ